MDPWGLVNWSSVGSGAFSVIVGGAGIYVGAVTTSSGIGAIVGVPALIGGTATFSWGVSEVIAGFLDAETGTAAPTPVVMGTLVCGGDMDDARLNELIYGSTTTGLNIGSMAGRVPSSTKLIGAGVDVINTGVQSVMYDRNNNQN